MNSHLSIYHLRQLIKGMVDADSQKQMIAHLKKCSTCRNQLLLQKMLLLSQRSESKPEGNHISDSSMAAYVNGILPAPQKVSVQQHLAECSECWENYLSMSSLMEELTEEQLIEPTAEIITAAEQLVSPSPLKKIRDYLAHFLPNLQDIFSLRYLIRYASATLIIVLVSVCIFVLSQNATKQKMQFRSQKNDLMRQVELLSPKNGEEIVSKVILFSWKCLPAAKRYHLILLNESGEKIFEEFTDKCNLRISTSILKHSGEHYFWRIEIFTETGVSYKSKLSYFIFERAK